MIHEHRNTRMRNRNLYVLTGGPGGGKSTVLDILDGMGYHTVREAGRKSSAVRPKPAGMPFRGPTRPGMPA